MKAGPDDLLDQVEAALRQSEQTAFADALMKLQQDCGLELDPDFNPDDRSHPPGPRAKVLWDAYEPVTPERFSILLQIASSLTDQNLCTQFTDFLLKEMELDVPTTPSSPPPAPPGPAPDPTLP